MDLIRRYSMGHHGHFHWYRKGKKSCKMKNTLRLLIAGAMLIPAAFSADSPTITALYDGQFRMIESELVPLAEAMPADKYNFAPTGGEFKGVRTFGAQAKHIAAVIYITAAAAKGEKVPVDTGGESGPDSVKTKAQIIAFLKDSFAYAHAAAATLNNDNIMDMVKSPFGGPDVARASVAMIPVWHSFDHYGQMVVYARMNGVIPPASKQ
jgi:hypothetical protein